MLYEDVFNYFTSKNCKLLTNEDDYKLLTQTRKIPKLRYIASCNHEHEVHFNVFKSRNTGIICPACHRKNDGIKRSGNASKTELGQSIGHFNEEKCIDYFIDIIKNDYECKKTFEGCLADLSIKPKTQSKDLWLNIQVKSNAKRLRTYSFTNNSNYKDCIILCICWEDKRMWIFDGNTMKLSKISIGYKKSKYEINEITKENVIEKLNTYYNNFHLSTFEESNNPICDLGKKELEFKKLRTKHVKCNFVEAGNYLHHDFIINNKKVQEKVGTKDKTENGVLFTLFKRCGKINNIKKLIPYDIGDNDLYWLHFPNKKYFYLLPENKVINNEGIIKRNFYIPITKEGKPKNDNLDYYLFDYDNIDYERFESIIN